MTRIELEVGILLCGRLRDYLNKCKFKGMQIEYFEGRGWLERDFVIRGKDSDIEIIDRDIKHWISSMES